MKYRPCFYIVALLFFISFGRVQAQYTENDWQERDGWMQLHKLYEWAGLETGDTVADVGCHEGYLSLRLAQTIGTQGKVYAVDVREDRLETLKRHVADRKLQNVKIVLGDYDNPKLPAAAMDIVFVIDTYHEMADYELMLSHLKNSLKPGGRIVILEKLKAHMKGKPRERQVEAHTLSIKYVKKELKDAGLHLSKEVKDFGIWNGEPDKRMWVLVATNPTL
ncbi:MAG: methyltransferase domain-containing protein [Bacteroidota bacterium]